MIEALQYKNMLQLWHANSACSDQSACQDNPPPPGHLTNLAADCAGHSGCAGSSRNGGRLSGTGGVDAGQLASISVIWLVLPFIVSGLLFLLFTLGMIFILARALRILPVYTHLVQLYANIINVRVKRILWIDWRARLLRRMAERQVGRLFEKT